MEDNKNTSEEDVFVDEDGLDSESSADHAAENFDQSSNANVNETSATGSHADTDDSQETVKHTGPRYGKFGWDMPGADERKQKSDWNAWKQANASDQQNTSSRGNGTDQQNDQHHAWNQQNDGSYRNWDQQNSGQQNGPSNGWQSGEPSNGWDERQQNAGGQYGFGNQQKNGYGNRQSYGYNNPQYGQPNGWRQPQGGRYTRPVDSEGRYLGRNLAIWSAVVGVIALSLFGTFINIPLAIIAIVLGVRHLRHYNRNMGRTAAKVGIVAAILSIVLFVGAYGLAATNKSFTNMVEQEMNSGSASGEIQQYLDEFYGQDNTDEL